jgi:methylenetetrahydrofolate dehydrogenase (NADP+)/methenyltetrahydrofolate cyclohydrolase
MLLGVKLLNGSELAEFIKERQVHQVRALIQADGIQPKLAIIVCTNNPVINTYIALKQRYGSDISVEVEVHKIDQKDALELIDALNKNNEVHGIIVQLPLADTEQTDEIVNAVAPQKDVDALGKGATLDPATPMAINWLLAGYNVDVKAKPIAIVGSGRLVGAPLKRLFDASNIEVTVVDGDTEHPEDVLLHSQIIITAVGKPGLITSNMIPDKCVVVDAATTSENGEIKGDLADDVYEREDITVTPRRGGVGPLTVVALFDNVIRAARSTKA